MTSLRILLVDDEPLAIERLQIFFADIADTEIVGTAHDGLAATEAIERLSPDIVILDIQMPGQNGLRVAATLPADTQPEIIFVTAFEQYAPDAFTVDAADYLLKPVRFDRLWQAVERAKRRRYLRSLEDRAAAIGSPPFPEVSANIDRDGIWVPTKTGSIFVPTDTIDWVEAARDYVMLHTQTRSHIMRLSMRAIEQRFDHSKLMRVHRSAFVRPDMVVELQHRGRTISAVILRDGATVQVGPSYSKKVAEQMAIIEPQ